MLAPTTSPAILAQTGFCRRKGTRNVAGAMVWELKILKLDLFDNIFVLPFKSMKLCLMKYNFFDELHDYLELIFQVQVCISGSCLKPTEMVGEGRAGA